MSSRCGPGLGRGGTGQVEGVVGRRGDVVGLAGLVVLDAQVGDGRVFVLENVRDGVVLVLPGGFVIGEDRGAEGQGSDGHQAGEGAELERK